jgi:hypothetical protein
MPRRLPKRPPRPPPRRSHRFLPSHLSHALILRSSQSLQSCRQGKKLQPKIVALDSVPRVALSPNPADHAHRLAQIGQIEQLYSPREFKQFREEQMKLGAARESFEDSAGTDTIEYSNMDLCFFGSAPPVTPAFFSLNAFLSFVLWWFEGVCL